MLPLDVLSVMSFLNNSLVYRFSIAYLQEMMFDCGFLRLYGQFQPGVERACVLATVIRTENEGTT